MSHPLHLRKQGLDELVIIQAHLAERPQGVCELARPHAVPQNVGLQQSHELIEMRVSLYLCQGRLQANDNFQSARAIGVSNQHYDSLDSFPLLDRSYPK